MKVYKICSALIVMLLFGCDSDEKVTVGEPVVLLNLSVDESFATGITDDWIVIHSSSGDLLTFQPFEVGDKLVIETDKPFSGDLITITTISSSGAGDEKHYAINTFMEVEKARTMVLKKLPNVEIPNGD